MDNRNKMQTLTVGQLWCLEEEIEQISEENDKLSGCDPQLHRNIDRLNEISREIQASLKICQRNRLKLVINN